jgi:hypothetical protein
MASHSDEGEETRPSNMEESRDAPSTTAEASVAAGAGEEGGGGGGAAARSSPTTTGAAEEPSAMEEGDGEEEDEEDEEVVAAGASANQQGQAGMQSLKGVLRELEEVEGMLGKVRAACGGGAVLSSTPAVRLRLGAIARVRLGLLY